MDFNEILNGTIASILSAVIIGIFSISYSYIKKKYKENNHLFLLKLKFYLCILAIVLDTYVLTNSASIQYFLLNLFPLIFVIICCIIAFHEALKYDNDNSKKI